MQQRLEVSQTRLRWKKSFAWIDEYLLLPLCCRSCFEWDDAWLSKKLFQGLGIDCREPYGPFSGTYLPPSSGKVFEKTGFLSKSLNAALELKTFLKGKLVNFISFAEVNVKELVKHFLPKVFKSLWSTSSRHYLETNSVSLVKGCNLSP